MHIPFFISINVIKKDGTKSVRFINSAHIIQVYEELGNVYIELTEYTVYHIDTPNIHAFMDRFIR